MMDKQGLQVKTWSDILAACASSVQTDIGENGQSMVVISFFLFMWHFVVKRRIVWELVRGRMIARISLEKA